MAIHAGIQMSARVTNIAPCIIQVTFTLVYYTLTTTVYSVLRVRSVPVDSFR